MYNIFTYDEILKDERFDNPIFIDLRSEHEFQKSTIPGSINLPILDNEERKIVGTTYKNKSTNEAKTLGVEMVSKKLPNIYKFLNAKSYEGQLILFCARGGYRSSVLFQLLRALDMKVYKLDHGYKAYRSYVNENLEKALASFEYVNLNGLTACGKTEILHELEKKANVLDLEGLANHRGSIFGGMGLGNQPSQKMFESLVYNKIRSFKGNLVLVESESIKLGSLQIFKSTHDKYTNSNHQVLITSPIEQRVERIKGDYLNGDLDCLDKEIRDDINKLKSYISCETYNTFIRYLEERKYDELIEEIMTNYYDKTYKKENDDFELVINNKDSIKAADKIYEYYKNLI